MMVFVPAVLAMFLMTGYQSVIIPQQQSALASAKADTAASNMLMYRRAAAAYYRANPGATGTVLDGSLAAYWPTGYVRNIAQWPWTNTINSGVLYVYSTSATCGQVGACAAVFGPLYQAQKNPVTVGVALASQLTNPDANVSTNIALPAAIQTGAVVLIGH